MLPGKLLTAEGGDAFADLAAQAILQAGLEAQEQRGRFTLALSGGSAPGPILRRLAEIGAPLSWRRVILIWVDERCVGPEDERSNYRLAKENLLDVLPVQPVVHRLRGEIDPAKAVESYEQLLRFAALTPDEPPVMDLALIGFGTDGHVASLFPGGPELEAEGLVTASRSPDGLARLSLTLPLLAAARTCLIIARGAAKRPVLEQLLAGDTGLPLSRLVHRTGNPVWVLDKDVLP